MTSEKFKAMVAKAARAAEANSFRNKVDAARPGSAYYSIQRIEAAMEIIVSAYAPVDLVKLWLAHLWMGLPQPELGFQLGKVSTPKLSMSELAAEGSTKATFQAPSAECPCGLLRSSCEYHRG